MPSAESTPPSVLRRLCCWLLFLSLTSCVVTGCSLRDALTPRELRVAVNPWPGYSFVFLAEELEYFQDEGVSVRLLELGSLGDGRRVFEHGQADVVFCTLAEVLLMNEADPEQPVQVFGTVDYSSGSDMLLAHRDVSDIAALRRCRVGVEPESVSGLCASLAFKSAGVLPDEVTLVPLANSEMLKAMRTRTVDAVQVYAPDSDAIEQLEGVHRLWDSGEAPGIILDVVASRQRILQDRSQELGGLLRAYDRAQRFYREHPQQAIAILARRCGVAEEVFRRSLEGLTILRRDDAETERLFQADVCQGITSRVADGLMLVGMLREQPVQVPFDPRFLRSERP